jgi:hypothetical protein
MTSPRTSVLISAVLVLAGALSWRAGTVSAGAGEAGLRPPAHLSETGLYLADPGKRHVIDPANHAFSPQYPLWTDGATKKRWVYLPPGGLIDASDEANWVLPVGTKFWKEFSFAGRRVETRLSWRATSIRWVFASYVWDVTGHDAVLAPDDGLVGAAEIQPGKAHNVPSIGDCAACHGTTNPAPLGFNLLQLSPDRDPAAIHGEPLEAGMLTIDALVSDGRLRGLSPERRVRAPRIATAHADTRAMLGYLVANCGHCHNGKGEIAAAGPILRLSELLSDGDAVAARLLGQRTSWLVPGANPGESFVIDPRMPELSAMLVRMRSRRPSSQMPPLGTVARDDEAVVAATKWVERLARSSDRAAQ